jgi:hypothetical protein
VVLQKGILVHIEVETKKFISKARQRKDRNIVHKPDMDAGTSDNRRKECSNIRSIYGEEVGWGLAQICFRKECSSLFVLSRLVLHCYQLGPETSRLAG